MKNQSAVIIILVCSVFLLWGCGQDPISPQAEDVSFNGPVVLHHTAASPFETDLIADGGDPTTEADVGDVLIWNDADNLYVKYVIEDPTPSDPRDDWHITETHLAVGDNFDEDIPTTGSGNPKIGHFPYSMFHDPSVSEYTYTIPLTDVDLSFGELAYIAAHAVVCQYGGLDGLEYSLPPSVTMKVQYPQAGGQAYFPNVTVTNGGFLNGSYPGWCVDTDNTIGQNTNYTANVYSSYESLPAGTVEFPENLDLVNWILNQNYVGQTSPNGFGTYTYGDVQRAIWTLVEDNLSTAGLGNWNQNRVDEILAAAYASGENFEPGCDEYVAVVLVPVAGTTPQQIIIAQVTLIELQILCETRCETAWGYGTGFPGKQWATYVEYTVQ